MNDNERFTEEALKAQDGKVVPVTAYPGGPVIGEAVLRYDGCTKELTFNARCNDHELAQL